MNLAAVRVASVLASGATIALGAAMASIAMGKIGKAALEGMTRQPEASGFTFTAMLIAMALVEALAIYTLLIALLLLMANPLVK